jgi:hypothetical protein
MIAHVVLFRPHAELPQAGREALADAFVHALEHIPLIRRARVGRRHRVHRDYEQAVAEDFPFAAILEFDSEADLLAYLDHPAHQELGRRLFESAERTLIYDFAVIEGSRAEELLK